MIKGISLYFTRPGEVELRQVELPEPDAGQVLVQSLVSAISPGSEMLVYRGLFPSGLAVDETLSSLQGEFSYPLKYGYSVVGRVTMTGAQVPSSRAGRLVFAFHPHESHFLAAPDELHPLPEQVPVEDAAFLPNTETAVNLVMDGRPVIGEKVLVFGQGIVGLLTTALLAKFPLGRLIVLDPLPLRRRAALELGAHLALDPASPADLAHLQEACPQGADLVYELSGSPAALDQAIQASGFAGRVVVGSWYGEKRTELDLGRQFHRGRTRLVSSQVSSLAPEYSGRWTKGRRLEQAWEMLRQIKPSRLVTQRFEIQQARQAYRLVDQSPEETIQVLFTYPE